MIKGREKTHRKSLQEKTAMTSSITAANSSTKHSKQQRTFSNIAFVFCRIKGPASKNLSAEIKEGEDATKFRLENKLIFSNATATHLSFFYLKMYSWHKKIVFNHAKYQYYIVILQRYYTQCTNIHQSVIINC